MRSAACRNRICAAGCSAISALDVVLEGAERKAPAAAAAGAGVPPAVGCLPIRRRARRSCRAKSSGSGARSVVCSTRRPVSRRMRRASMTSSSPLRRTVPTIRSLASTRWPTRTRLASDSRPSVGRFASSKARTRSARVSAGSCIARRASPRSTAAASPSHTARGSRSATSNGTISIRVVPGGVAIGGGGPAPARPGACADAGRSGGDQHLRDDDQREQRLAGTNHPAVSPKVSPGCQVTISTHTLPPVARHFSSRTVAARP